MPLATRGVRASSLRWLPGHAHIHYQQAHTYHRHTFWVCHVVAAFNYWWATRVTVKLREAVFLGLWGALPRQGWQEM